MPELPGRVRAVLRSVGNALGPLGEAAFEVIVRNKIAEYTPIIISYMDGMGIRRIQFVVNHSDLTLWELLPPDWRQKAIADEGSYSEFVSSLDPLVISGFIKRELDKGAPKYAKIVTEDWLVRSFKAYQKAKKNGRYERDL